LSCLRAAAVSVESHGVMSVKVGDLVIGIFDGIRGCN
jgi:hypothetical protein